MGAINGNDRSATTFSSWGPTDDGRIKPDLVAPGCENPRSDSSPGGSIWSLAGGGEGYTGWCGTSMAAPVVSGGVALLREELAAQGRAVSPSLVRALLIHTCRFGPHSKGDDTRPAELIEHLRLERDPLKIQAARLPEAVRLEIESGVDEEILVAFEKALADSTPTPVTA